MDNLQMKVNEPDSMMRHWPTDDRPACKLIARGADALSDAELVSLLLRTGKRPTNALSVDGKSALDCARDLLARYGSMSALCLAEPGAQSGLTGEQSARIAATMEIARRCLREKLDRGSALGSPQAVRDYLRLKLQDRPHEVFVAVFLDAQNRVLAVDELFRGTLTQTSVYPREVVKRALHYNAAAIIFAHNHPSGIAEPSRSDETLTQALKQSLALVDVKVLDHFVVGAGAAMSFAERGLL